MGHRHVGVDAVADHGYLVGLQSVTVEYAREHVGVGLAECYVGAASRGVFETFAYRAAVDQYDALVGGTYAVGVGGYVGHTLRNPPCCAAETVVGECHIESRYDCVGYIVGVVAGRDEARLFELRDHRRRAQEEQTACLRQVGLDVVDRGQRRGVHLLARGFDAQLRELVQVVVDRFRGVVREERIADAQLLQSRQKGLCA